MKAKLKMNLMKAAIWLPLVLFIGLKSVGEEVPKKIDNYPIKTNAYWTSPSLGSSEIDNLSKHDLLVVDLENKFNNYQNLLKLKEKNPKLKLLCYFNFMEIFLTKYTSRPWQNKIIDEITMNRQAWLLKTITPIENANQTVFEELKNKFLNSPKYKEDYATFWAGMTMLNVSTSCPKINEQTYSEWMADKLITEILSDPIWDGCFIDNCTADIAWMHPNKIDIDGDKQADRNVVVDYEWKQGVTKFIAKIKQKKSNKFIIIGNKGDLNFLNLTDGKLFEKFPNNYLGERWAGGFRQSLKNAEKTGNYTIFQANRANIQFVLAASLLLDNVYLAISQDDAGYFPELNIVTGRPLGRYEIKNGIYYRSYEKVEIMVDPLKKIGKVTIKK